MEGEFTESIYNKSTETTKNYLKGIHAKLKTYGTYGKRKAAPQDKRGQSLAYMTEKYGERAMQDLVNRHSGE